MYREFKKYFYENLEKRIKEVTTKAKSNRKYSRLKERMEELHCTIFEKLQNKNEHLIFNYAEVENAIDKIMYEKIYKSGLYDGIRLANTCHKVTKI